MKIDGHVVTYITTETEQSVHSETVKYTAPAGSIALEFRFREVSKISFELRLNSTSSPRHALVAVDRINVHLVYSRQRL